MRWVARVLVVAAGLCGQLDAAEAKKPPNVTNAAGKQRADQWAEQGLAALKAGQLAEATTAFGEAFRTSPNPKWLFHLGQVAAAEKKSVEARDLLRRYLNDTTVDADDPLKKEAQTLLDAQPVVDAGEILVVGPRGALLSVDGRFVGSLPLSMPLLLPTGPHRVVASQDRWQAASEVKTRLARQVELRFKSGSDVAVVTLPPAVLVVDQAPDAQTAEAVQKRVQTALSRESYAVVPRRAVELYAKDLALCLTDVSCLRKAAAKFGVEFVLWARTEKQGNGWRVVLNLRDAATGTELGSNNAQCDSCSIDGVLAKVGETTGSLTSAAVSRDRGDVEIRSTPADTEVVLDGQVLGAAPIKQSLLAGRYALLVRKPGYIDHSQQIEIKGSGTLVVDVNLLDRDAQMEPAPAVRIEPMRVTTAAKRPLWRYAAGAAGIGIGVVLIGFGISAFVQNGVVLDGTCPSSFGVQRCQFGTIAPGVGLTVTGALLAGAGAALIAWPPPKPRAQVAIFGEAGGLSVGVSY